MKPKRIATFFDSYRAAFDALDARAVAAHFAAPSMLIEDKAHVWMTADEVAANMERLLALYRDNGYAGASYEIESSMPQGDAAVTANLIWTIARQGGAPWRFRTSYTLRWVDDVWKIVLCIAYEERAARG